MNHKHLSSIIQIFIKEHDAWFSWYVVAVCAGICWYFSLSREPTLSFALALLATTFIAYIACYRYGIRHIILLGVCVSLGFACSVWRSQQQYAPMISFTTKKPITVIGTVIKLVPKQDRRQILLSDIEIAGVPKDKTPKYIRLTVNTTSLHVKVYDYVAIKVMIAPPKAPVIPGGFDFARYTYFMQIGATGYTISDVKVLWHQPIPWFSKSTIEIIRNHIIDIIQHSMSPEYAGIMTALLIGEYGYIDQDTMLDVRYSGLAHLIAISGMHLTLIASFFFFVCRAILALSQHLTLHYPIEKWAAWFALIGTFLYLLITGMPVSATRAFIMTAIFLISIIMGRSRTSMRSVSLAALLIVLYSPEALLNAGFQMSFAAVIALIKGFDKTPLEIDNMIKRNALQKVIYSLKQSTMTSIIATIATLPYTIYHFNYVSVYGIFANLIAIPLTMMWIMPVGILAIITIPLGLQALPLYFAEYGIYLLLQITHYTANIEGAVRYFPALPVSALLFLTLGGLWLCFWQTKKLAYSGGVLLISIGLLLYTIKPMPDILVDQKGGLFALKTSHGDLVVSSRRFARFAREVWLQRFGQHDYLLASEVTDPLFSCTPTYCLYKKEHHRVLITYKEMPEHIRCNDITALIYLSPTTIPCQHIPIISQNDLKIFGTHAVYLSKHLTIDTVKKEKRPWN